MNRRDCLGLAATVGASVMLDDSLAGQGPSSGPLIIDGLGEINLDYDRILGGNFHRLFRDTIG